MVIYGASGHGKVICDILKSQYNDISIIFVDDVDKGDVFYNLPLMLPKTIDLHHHDMIIGIGNNKIRQHIAQNYSKFLTATHPSAIISPSASIGLGTTVMANCSVNAECKIGNHVILNTSCSVDHDCIIEDYAHISPNASLAGNVKVGIGAHIGIGSSVIQGIKIGKFATVGAGSVVIRDVPDGATVVGSPARIIKID